MNLNQVIKFLIWMMKAFGLNWAGAVNRVHLVGYALMFASQKFQIFGRFGIFFKIFDFFFENLEILSFQFYNIWVIMLMNMSNRVQNEISTWLLII